MINLTRKFSILSPKISRHKIELRQDRYLNMRKLNFQLRSSRTRSRAVKNPIYGASLSRLNKIPRVNCEEPPTPGAQRCLTTCNEMCRIKSQNELLPVLSPRAQLATQKFVCPCLNNNKIPVRKVVMKNHDK